MERFLVFAVKGTPAEWTLFEPLVQYWESRYPTLDVRGELYKADAWIDANPTRKKTARGMKAFLVNWLNRATRDPRRVPVKVGQVGGWLFDCPHPVHCRTMGECAVKRRVVDDGSGRVG